VIGLTALMLTCGCRRPADDPNSSGRSNDPEPQNAISFLQTNKLLGKPVLIEFGMVGCELSDKGFKTMIALHKDGLVAGLEYARVETSDDAEAVDAYYKSNPAGFLVAKDPKGELADVFGATIYPVFLLIDKFGNTRYMGGFPEDDLGDWSEMLAAEESNPGSNTPRLGVKELNGPELLAATKLPALDGAEQALSEYMGPGGMMLVFADANCPYSGHAIRDLPSVSLTLKKAALIRTVVVNITDSEDKVKEYYAKQKLSVPVVYDVGSNVRINWDVQSVPTIILCDAQGRIAYNGPAVWADVGRAGEMALGLRPGSLKFQARGTKFG
jgi:hypothetical protein